MYGRAFRSGEVRFVAHGVDAAGVDPPIIKVEQSADRNGVINGFVAEAGVM